MKLKQCVDTFRTNDTPVFDTHETLIEYNITCFNIRNYKSIILINRINKKIQSMN